MDDLGIKYVWGVPYSPQYQPIENVFSMVKNNYQNQLVWYLINKKKFDKIKLIKKSFQHIETTKIQRCIDHARLVLRDSVDND